MRILFVAFPESVHTARWINQISTARDWDVHLFPVSPLAPNPALENVTVHPYSPYERFVPRKTITRCKRSVRSVLKWARARTQPMPTAGADWDAFAAPSPRAPEIPPVERLIERLRPRWFQPARRLARLIRELRPDVVHSFEIQHGGYLTLAASNLLDESERPTWIVSNWGSDISLFGRDSEHAARIREVMAHARFSCAECNRDARLGREFGFTGVQWPILPNAGGFRIDQLLRARQPGPTSSRRAIMLKGYHSWAGRSLVGMAALARCADVLHGYRVYVYSGYHEPAVVRATKSFAEQTGIQAEIVPRTGHEEILRLHGQARISIGLSISDGISMSLLEAMTMGSLPIQSCTACADEWIVNGKSGLIVPPEDVEQVAAAIRRAVLDDELVDRAAEINLDVARRRLDYGQIQQQVLAMYDRILAQRKAA